MTTLTEAAAIVARLIEEGDTVRLRGAAVLAMRRSEDAGLPDNSPLEHAFWLLAAAAEIAAGDVSVRSVAEDAARALARRFYLSRMGARYDDLTDDQADECDRIGDDARDMARAATPAELVTMAAAVA